MSSSTDHSFEQTMDLLEVLSKHPNELTSGDLAHTQAVTRDLGDRSKEFRPGEYLGSAVKRALDDHE